MNLLDKLHDKALTAKKKHVKYPLLIASGIADWFAGTYDEIKGHGEAAKDTGHEKDYKLYEDGIKGAALGEVGAFAAAVHTRNKPAGLLIGADLIVRDLNALVSLTKGLKRVNEDPDYDGTINADLTGAIGTARTLVYKLANKYRRSGEEFEEFEDGEGDDFDDAESLIFPEPLPEPIKEDEMRIMDNIEPEYVEPDEDGSEAEDEEDLLPLEFDPQPSPGPVELPGPEPEPFKPEPVKLPGPGEGYSLPDIMEPEDEPAVEYHLPDLSDLELTPDEPLDEIPDEMPETPSPKPKVDIGPLGKSYSPSVAEPQAEEDEEDPLAYLDEEDDDSGNKLF